jgi:hypothetical protein
LFGRFAAAFVDQPVFVGNSQRRSGYGVVQAMWIGSKLDREKTTNGVLSQLGQIRRRSDTWLTPPHTVGQKVRDGNDSEIVVDFGCNSR